MASSILQFFSTADNVTAVAVASYVLSQAGRGLYRRTVGSRRLAAKALRSLTPGNPIERVEQLFGQHVYTRKYTQLPPEYAPAEPEYEIEQRLYNARHGWLTVHYNDGKLCAFAFMLTDPRFRFTLDATCRGVISGTLGRITFHEIWDETPSAAEMFLGAYNYGYSEIHYFGRPGNYQYYSFSNTMHGWSARRASYGDVGNVEIGRELSAHDLPWRLGKALREFRRTAAPDTVAVFGDGYRLDHGGSTSGSYDQDDMRNLEGDGPRGWMSSSAFARREEKTERRRVLMRRLVPRRRKGER